VAFTPVVSVAKLGEHSICGRVAETVLAEVSDDGRLPSAIDAPPAVALETENPEAAVVRIVAAVTAGATPFVMFTLPRAAVLFARTSGSEFGTARGRAGAQDPPYPTLRVGYRARLGIRTDQGWRDLGELHVGLGAAYLCHRDVSGPSSSELSVL
jgi:hypothetical protein